MALFSSLFNPEAVFTLASSAKISTLSGYLEKAWLLVENNLNKMKRYPTGPVPCRDDPSCDVRITSMLQPGPISIFALWGLVIVSCSTFQVLKLLASRRKPVKPIIYHGTKPLSTEEVQRPPNTNSVTREAGLSECDIRLNVEGQAELRFTGYKTTVFGEWCYLLCCLVSLHWMAIFVLILVDTYNGCQVGGIDNLCFFGNNFIFGTYELNGKIFFTVWWLAVFWYTTWVLNKGRVHNWFRTPCPFDKASVVYIWAKDEKQILSVNVFSIVHFLRNVKRQFISPNTRGHFDCVKIESTKAGQRFIIYQGQRFNIYGNCIDRAEFKVGCTLNQYHQGVEGLSKHEAEERLEQVGLNEIPFRPEPLLYIIIDELFSLFHVYQLLMYILQFWNSYLFVAALMTFIVLISASITIFTRRHSQIAISKITEYITDAVVMRKGRWTEIDSRKLVPGDLLKIRSDWLLPCDLLILQGSCICDESALTGESMPVQKYAAPDSLEEYLPEARHGSHTLFSGTTVLQAGVEIEDDVLAIVTTTGMKTSKGQLISSILYPEKMLFKYDEELPLVVTLLVIYGMVCFAISLYFQTQTGAQSFWVTKWIYCMAILSQILSPLLPVALEIGQLQAVERLKGRKIFCLNPKRIAIAGKIRVFCFDKTGTLTKEGLDFTGVQSVIVDTDGNGLSFGPLQTLEKENAVDAVVSMGLATCHAVTKFGDRLVGNQVEVKMFASVGWRLLESPDNLPSVSRPDGTDVLTIVKRNDFDHARATMSVIVQDSEKRHHIFCKGSFERIHDLSSPGSLPGNYAEVSENHALDGCYVLGLAHRMLPEGTSLEDVLALSRDEVEQSLDFLALILFRNELKPESLHAIQDLKQGEVRPLMVTGDNAQCGYYIAKECGMVAPYVSVMLGDVCKDGSVGWTLFSSQKNSTVFSTEDLLKIHLKGIEGGVMELAVTGRAFEVLRTSNLMEKLLFYTRIFARFKPEDKVKVIDMHRACGLIVGMCGDGGNDCGALRAAHAGIALSEAEASVVSPFTSKDKSVASVVDLLREGRGALHTSFACYKFLIMYGLMFSILKLCCYWYGIIPCQMDYVFIDGVAVLSLGYAMTLSYPERKLGKMRPTSSLIGAMNTGSILGVWIINIVFMIGALLLMNREPGYVKWPAKYSHGADWWTLGDNWESTVLFFTMYFQYITSAFVFSFGASFRRNVLFNWFLTVTYWGLVVFMSFLLLLPHSGFTELWHVSSEQFNSPNPISPVWSMYQTNGGHPSPEMSFSFRFRLWWLIVANICTNVIWQKVVAEGPVAKYVAKTCPSIRPRFHL
ncbi:hypothetical protein MPTK1_8g05990 [Marchantia polymorpha subsp. ruderalis]|uniref:Uncharacterized protein n=2 Tax=Marchantia polymorpha TaxID=3197 RepID=A0A2R6XIQ8_MARPO|nr:hypothetical protein MARPO_0013s0191 [Marchantia polymorpha]BBN18845.1 hypothetical protein Mp_8g05990 [Marchantia polymorpha subsp. ruderalis]|eukprot:PTQ45998.1 hypothetical protein MARPO_0013s0191 [Marchantia polymorpha]